MAIIKNLSTEETVFIKSLHVFGRNREKADTELKSKDISQIHASIRWDGWEWIITDFSRNGIWINGIRLVPGKNRRLMQGDIIHFGRSDNMAWELSDLKPPSCVLFPIGHDGPCIELERLHALPDNARPEILVYLSHTGRWVYENENGMIPLTYADIIHHRNGSWQFFCAEPVDKTLAREEIKEVRFIFYVSVDEEHVVVKMQLGEEMIDLGERAHHYMLLTLARQRLKDALEGSDEATQGWIDLERMSEMLDLEPCHLNIQIFRARKQINAALPETFNFPQVVERRVGGLRFGCPDFQILRGSTVEGVLCRGAYELQSSNADQSLWL